MKVTWPFKLAEGSQEWFINLKENETSKDTKSKRPPALGQVALGLPAMPASIISVVILFLMNKGNIVPKVVCSCKSGDWVFSDYLYGFAFKRTLRLKPEVFTYNKIPHMRDSSNLVWNF